jgi:hypothetical protein
MRDHVGAGSWPRGSQISHQSCELRHTSARSKIGKLSRRTSECLFYRWGRVKLKLISVGLAGLLVPIMPSNAQSISPAGHYTKRVGGDGEMLVQKAPEGWSVFVRAGGTPNGGVTAADCAIAAVGAIKGNAFQGEIKYGGDIGDEKFSPDNEVKPGHKINITFASKFATLTTADVADICGIGTGLFGRYTRDQN